SRGGAPARCWGALIIFLFLVLVILAVKTRLMARALRHGHGCARTRFPADHAADARLPAQKRMRNHAEPRRGVIGVVFFAVFFVVDLTRRRFFIVVGRTCGQEQCRGRRQTKDDAQDETREQAEWRTENPCGRSQYGVASNSAESSWKRPRSYVRKR